MAVDAFPVAAASIALATCRLAAQCPCPATVASTSTSQIPLVNARTVPIAISNAFRLHAILAIPPIITLALVCGNVAATVHSTSLRADTLHAAFASPTFVTVAPSVYAFAIASTNDILRCFALALTCLHATFNLAAVHSAEAFLTFTSAIEADASVAAVIFFPTQIIITSFTIKTAIAIARIRLVVAVTVATAMIRADLNVTRGAFPALITNTVLINAITMQQRAVCAIDTMVAKITFAASSRTVAMHVTYTVFSADVV